jgi:hypothetical protein
LIRPSPEESARKFASGLKEVRRSRMGATAGAMGVALRVEGFRWRRRWEEERVLREREVREHKQYF